MTATLYYDGACPLCRKEIALLRDKCKILITFVDIHQLDDHSFNEIPSKDTLLRRLHLQKETGEWLLGLDANVYLWSQTPYGYFFKILRLPPFALIADTIYVWWADRRYKKRYVCSSSNTGNSI